MERLMRARRAFLAGMNTLLAPRQTAQSDLTRQSESLRRLETEINVKQKERQRMKRQRDTWAVVAGMLVVGLAVK